MDQDFHCSQPICKSTMRLIESFSEFLYSRLKIEVIELLAGFDFKKLGVLKLFG